MERKIGFSYGVLCDSLQEQAHKQGFELKESEKFEEIRKAINMCGFYVATDSQVNSMLKKLHNQVIKNLVPLEVNKNGEN